MSPNTNGPPERRRSAPPQDRPTPLTTDSDTECTCPPRQSASRQIAWFTTFEFANAIAQLHGYDLSSDHFPPPGSPAWCDMADHDDRKLLALLQRGVQAALDDDARQAAMADASHEICAATRWRPLAVRHLRGRGPAYVPRRTVP